MAEDKQSRLDKLKQDSKMSRGEVAALGLSTLNNAIPSDLKKKGVDKLSSLLMQKGNEIKTQIEFKLRKEVEKIKDVDVCANQELLNQFINTRNNVVNKLNSINNTLNIVTTSITGVSTFFDVLLTVKQTLSTAKLAATIALKAIPPPVLPGAVVSVVDDLDELERKVTYDSLGASKLQPIKSGLDGAEISTSLVANQISTTITLLRSLDAFIKNCNIPDSSLTPVSNELLQIADQANLAERQVNNATYKGFIINIEEVPFTPNVNRRRAIGLNRDNIKLIETPLSFTTNPQTLIDELKFIIDRDNLKAD